MKTPDCMFTEWKDVPVSSLIYRACLIQNWSWQILDGVIPKDTPIFKTIMGPFIASQTYHQIYQFSANIKLYAHSFNA